MAKNDGGNSSVRRDAKSGRFLITEGQTVRGGVVTTNKLHTRPPAPPPNKTPPSKKS